MVVLAVTQTFLSLLGITEKKDKVQLLAQGSAGMPAARGAAFP